jgi:hypothetical protein
MSTEMEAAVKLIADERRRQVEKEGWTPEHDDEHENGELAKAASCYADPRTSAQKEPPNRWPWAREWWKPNKDRVRDLVKAGALIIAEIERLQRNGGEHG